jgi:hypothetical protein
MTDIFLSYSSKDRARIQRLRDALVDCGFTLFWDQEIPATTDWDTWIRQHLNESRCAVVVWSSNSVASDNVRHEALIAKQQNKLIPVLFDPISADRFPMGLYAVQAADLSSWTGDLNNDSWLRLLNQVESMLAPPWLRRTLDGLEAQLVGERSRRETAERRDRTLRDQIAKEAEAQQHLRVELDEALHQVKTFKELVSVESAARSTADARIVELRREIAAGEDRQQSLAKINQQSEHTIEALERKISELQESLAARPPKLDDSVYAIPATHVASVGSTAVVTALPRPEHVAPTTDERWRAWEAGTRSSDPRTDLERQGDSRGYAILAIVMIVLLGLLLIVANS